ncbi:SIS domain-containing protein [Bradyrhizobium sp. WD16]|uniref:SIS domain-containing protein n=1 Tax=Bradyrhizobium sp. WD16 TaxID=1521768 RepID=UPI0020A5046C|nr:SIS domain-containing protein [Bradyrhizobium sp. WD16]UTD28392.1 phosphoheptose isomerase [Bradyrhizobium sp. WD16]
MNAHAFTTPTGLFTDYSKRLSALLQGFDWSPVERLAHEFHDCWLTGRQVFFMGNGGSGGNANHLANDFLYAVSKLAGSGLRVQSLAANPSVLTCLANDEGYDQVFSLQLAVQARRGDVLVALSGSGNSANILRGLDEARRIGMTSYALLGYNGGKAKDLADVSIHFPIQDMQISEDAQMIVGHMIMQWLYSRRGDIVAPPAATN